MTTAFEFQRTFFPQQINSQSINQSINIRLFEVQKYLIISFELCNQDSSPVVHQKPLFPEHLEFERDRAYFKLGSCGHKKSTVLLGRFLAIIINKLCLGVPKSDSQYQKN